MGLHNSKEKKENIFSHSGPKHLTSEPLDWKNDVHRRSVAACLVNGAYVLERDRQRKPKVCGSLFGRLFGKRDNQAPPWWESFDFELSKELVDGSGSTIFGAIYEYKPRLRRSRLDVGPPRYVIAFRGTLIKRRTIFKDLKLGAYMLLYRLQKKSRFDIAMKVVEEMVDEFGESNVWLAGHSLGAAIAMLVGRTMAKKGIRLESFLFNPPFQPLVSASFGKIKSKEVKLGFRIIRNLFKYGWVKALAKAMNKSNPFDALSAWEPRLFVNPKDPVGSECISYFEDRERMEEIGLGKVDKLATQYSFIGLFMKVLGKSTETFHLIPCANLTVNHTCCKGFSEAHGINQWWQPNLDLRSKRYSWPTSTSYATNEEADDTPLLKNKSL